jgi:uncharacterized protein (DUF1330 family)
MSTVGTAMAANAKYVRVVGLQVNDAELYRRYRAGMTPILERHGGHFGYDFVVADVLTSESDQPINRVFTLVFPTRAASQRMFADSDYLRVRGAFFEAAVSAVTILAEFEQAPPHA